MIQNPLVSIVIASYQHENFVIESIQSVLNQSFQDFEIIITDDGSSDGTVQKIKTIKDSRITLFEFQENLGACYALNNCIINSKGKYIAVMNSDDIWTKEKLEKQVNFLSNNESVSAVFSAAEFYDENLKKLSNKDKPFSFDIFIQKNRSSGEWLRTFFYEGNCLCHPSLLIKRSCYDEIGLYNNRLRQLPDLDMWIRFCKKYTLHILPDKLVQFRLLSDNKNASSPSSANRIRARNEFHLIMKSFFDDIKVETFKEGFSNKLRNKNFTTLEEFEIEKALIYLKTMHSIIGIEKLFLLLNNNESAELLEANYRITDKEFQTLSALSISFGQEDVYIALKSILLKIKRYPKLKLIKFSIKVLFNYILSIFKKS